MSSRRKSVVIAPNLGADPMVDNSSTSLAVVLTALSAAVSALQEERNQAKQPTLQPSVTVESEGPAFIAVPEAAKLLGLSRASAYRYAAAGLLPVKRFGRRIYVIRARLKEVVIPDAGTISEVNAA